MLMLAGAERWRELCHLLGVEADEREYQRLIGSWRSFGRYYHTLTHLEACLCELDVVRDCARRPAEVEFALWFHDAVYRSWRHDNESRSADWAARVLGAGGVEPSIAARVRDAVLATAHRSDAVMGDAALVVDIDLSILGQAPQVYDGFERSVRREYWWVPSGRFRSARGAVLRGFLERPRIYHHAAMRERYEAQARRNLGRALALL
jgi:predicted metal-dependent HD superfamily phosphohydrolase